MNPRLRPWLLPVAATVLVLAVGLGQCSTIGAFISGRKNTTTVTHDLVVDRVRNVAKLVSAEATVRDVLVYRNTWYGSTKQSLVVVTARLLAGIDLQSGTEVKIDEKARRIEIALPHASMLAVEVTDLRTYDEQRGLWNPFRPEDRDRIFRLAREQLARSADQMRLAGRAESSAKEMLETMFGVEGWVAEVRYRDVPTVRSRDEE
ncbi:MAG TPA: DUF4230 domain-containing protein [Gemmatimonadaceae bacterium]|jgi:hypothetical protein|nr:DUF4230 domain-containing protein [Gemmatimonadaceae bacterium]